MESQPTKGFEMRHTMRLLTGAFIANFALISPVFCESEPPRAAAPSKSQQVLDQSAADRKYAFILFYKEDSNATRAMAQTIKKGVGTRQEQTNVTYVQVTDPQESAIVKRFGVQRAAMPMAMAIAPNGAITAIFPPNATTDQIDNAFVTPTMMRVMKALQEGRLVFVCVQGSDETTAPPAIAEFQTDSHFQNRIATVSFEAADPDEGKLLKQMQLDSRAKTTKTVLLAPPGVLVGKFDSTTTKDEIAAAIAKAGKCCEDPNCKHNQGTNGRAPQTGTTSPRTRR